MKRIILLSVALFASISLLSQEREMLWPKGKMPDFQEHQIAARKIEADKAGFKAEKHRLPYIEWFGKPANPNGCCMLLIAGGGYDWVVDEQNINNWCEKLTERGVQCVRLVYRTPRPKGLPFYQSAWEDGQRAVRLVRSEAARRGFDPEKIGTVSMSAGSHMSVLLGTSSETPAYQRIDAIDDIPAHINWAIVSAPAYATSDAYGIAASREGYGPDIKLPQEFKFDSHTCPMCLLHGGKDPYSPNGSTLIYRQLRRMGIPAELHLYADKPHGVYGFERGLEFMTQMGYLGKAEPEVELVSRFSSDSCRAEYVKEPIWPEGKMPDRQKQQCEPYIEWHIPVQRTSDAIQIIYAGGSYLDNSPDCFEVAPIRRYLNAKGVTVVTMKYRTPRPENLPKHLSAWQDLQRAIRIVRSEAPKRGLNPDKIGIMGGSAGGHLTLMGVSSSLHSSYRPIDELDKLSCRVQWGVGMYPAYSLTDGLDEENIHGGNEDCDIPAPEFSFDLNTAPMIFIHGDADGWSAMASVKIWEKMRAMGIQGELHTLALRKHDFQRCASPGTGSFNWMDRIWDFLTAKGFVK